MPIDAVSQKECSNQIIGGVICRTTSSDHIIRARKVNQVGRNTRTNSTWRPTCDLWLRDVANHKSGSLKNPPEGELLRSRSRLALFRNLIRNHHDSPFAVMNSVEIDYTVLIGIYSRKAWFSRGISSCTHTIPARARHRHVSSAPGLGKDHSKMKRRPCQFIATAGRPKSSDRAVTNSV